MIFFYTFYLLISLYYYGLSDQVIARLFETLTFITSLWLFSKSKFFSSVFILTNIRFYIFTFLLTSKHLFT